MARNFLERRPRLHEYAVLNFNGLFNMMVPEMTAGFFDMPFLDVAHQLWDDPCFQYRPVRGEYAKMENILFPIFSAS